ncbi:MAG: radical SAM protein [Bdellovibrionales bacterium]|nr:twitch domain-containing radical SAM protein [Bdellovibrionales bacterium]NQZ19217.1 radical SAM protein [Bdellovibrionales bacterium]
MSSKNKVDEPFEIWSKSENKSWCPIPWLSCSTTTNGHYRLCVQANTHRESRGLFYDDKGTPLKASTHRMSEARNSELAKEVRKSMLKGEFHPVCMRCKDEESAKLISRRILARFNHENYYKHTSFEELKKHTQPDGTIEHEKFPLKELDLRMGNRCNLKCRSCYPGESSGWYSEWYDTKSKKFHSSHQDIQLKKTDQGSVVSEDSTMDWAVKSKLLPHLFDDAPEMYLTAIVGGEPFLIQEHFKALEEFVKNEKAADVIIDYNTNMTFLPQKALDTLKNFKEIKLGYSIDGVGKVNDYIRYPSKWETIEKNLRKLDEAPGNYDVWPTVTVMAYNVLYIPEIVKWQIESKFKTQNRSSMVMFLIQHPLRNPPEMSAQILPTKVKEVVVKKYKEFQSGWFEDYITKNLEVDEQQIWQKRLEYLFSTILNRLQAKDLSEHLPEFFKRTQIMDEYREESFSESLPELYSLLKKYM